MTYQEMIDQIRINIDDTLFTRYPKQGGIDKLMRNFINIALRKVYNKLVSLEIYPRVKETSITINNNPTELSFKFRKIIAVQDEYALDIPLVEEREARLSTVPAIFIRHDPDNQYKSIGYYITPSSLTLTIQYLPEIDLFTPADNVNNINNSIDEDHHDLVVYWATVMALAPDEDNMQIWIGIYDNELLSFMESVGDRSKEVVESDSWYE